jgi:hypothetical protein
MTASDLRNRVITTQRQPSLHLNPSDLTLGACSRSLTPKRPGRIDPLAGADLSGSRARCGRAPERRCLEVLTNTWALPAARRSRQSMRTCQRSAMSRQPSPRERYEVARTAALALHSSDQPVRGMGISAIGQVRNCERRDG